MSEAAARRARPHLMRMEEGEELTTLGSFAIERFRQAGFKPWRESAEPDADAVPAAEPDADPYGTGFEDGCRAAEQALADERAAIARLAESLDVLRPEPTNALAILLAETVERLVRQIVGQVEMDSALLVARAEAAAALIGNETAPARLRVHPDDLQFFIGARIPVEIMADSHVERGGLKLETGQGWIEDGPSVRLDRLRAELDRLGAPQ
jgi:flagellar assembly protein FliH